MNESAEPTVLLNLLTRNQKTVTFFYRLATGFLVSALVVHLAFASWYLIAVEAATERQTWLFLVFNGTALLVEVLLGRIAFMLAARAGQLVDTRYAIELSRSGIDIARLESAARALMSMRRDVGALRILEVETMLERLTKKYCATASSTRVRWATRIAPQRHGTPCHGSGVHGPVTP